MIDDVIMHGTLRHLWKKKTREKDVVGIVTFDLTGYFPPITLLLILQWHTGVCEETFDVKRRTIFEISLSESRIYKKWQTSAIIREISDCSRLSDCGEDAKV